MGSNTVGQVMDASGSTTVGLWSEIVGRQQNSTGDTLVAVGLLNLVSHWFCVLIC